MRITRQQIIEALNIGLKNDPTVFAFWLEGADVHDRVDQYSDIDIWLDVKDTHESKILKKAETILSRLGKIDFAHEVEHPHPKIRQKFFHLKNTSEFLIIDVCIQSHSRVFWYTKEFKDEKAKIIFDKSNVVQYKSVDQKKFNKEISDRVQELEKTFIFFQAWVNKSINRENFLEALGSYHEKVLQPLVEILRIRYEPTKKDFYLNGISLDIPKKILKELEDLYKINSINDIKAKSQKANKLFFTIIKTWRKRK